MPLLSEQLGSTGVYESLRALNEDPRGALESIEYRALMESLGVTDAAHLLHELEGLGLLTRVGTSVGLSAKGTKTTLLLQALNGDDLSSALRRLKELDGSLVNYSLVREGMTTGFFKSLVNQPNVGRLYICSPWINLTSIEERYLKTAILSRRRRRRDPEIQVITRPDDGRGTRADNLAPFLDLGASVFLHKKLHAKLYIREPDSAGGYIMAVVGSQNLTRSKYLELGIRIESDSVIIGKLISYFYNISYHSQELTN